MMSNLGNIYNNMSNKDPMNPNGLPLNSKIAQYKSNSIKNPRNDLNNASLKRKLNQDMAPKTEIMIPISKSHLQSIQQQQPYNDNYTKIKDIFQGQSQQNSGKKVTYGGQQSVCVYGPNGRVTNNLPNAINKADAAYMTIKSYNQTNNPMSGKAQMIATTQSQNFGSGNRADSNNNGQNQILNYNNTSGNGGHSLILNGTFNIGDNNNTNNKNKGAIQLVTQDGLQLNSYELNKNNIEQQNNMILTEGIVTTSTIQGIVNNAAPNIGLGNNGKYIIRENFNKGKNKKKTIILTQK